MKKTGILIVVLILGMSQLKAQYKPFVFGLEFAPNIGWLKSDLKDYENEGTEVGFSWGFVSEFYLMENYAIATGFDVVYLNGRLSYPHALESGSDTVGTLNRKYKTKYLEIPLALKMKTNEFGKMRFYGKVGLGTAFLLSAKGKDKFTSDPYNKSFEEDDIKDEMKVFRESLILGAGIEYLLGGSTLLTFGITFDNGFTDVLKYENTADPDVNHKAINNYLELNMGIIF